MNRAGDRSNGLMSSEEVGGLPVFDRWKIPRIGTIDHMMIDRISGHVAYAVLCLKGCPGLYPIPWCLLRYEPSVNGYRADFTEEELWNAPPFDDRDWKDPDWALLGRSVTNPGVAVLSVGRKPCIRRSLHCCRARWGGLWIAPDVLLFRNERSRGAPAIARQTGCG